MKNWLLTYTLIGLLYIIVRSITLITFKTNYVRIKYREITNISGQITANHGILRVRKQGKAAGKRIGLRLIRKVPVTITGSLTDYNKLLMGIVGTFGFIFFIRIAAVVIVWSKLWESFVVEVYFRILISQHKSPDYLIHWHFILQADYVRRIILRFI